MIFVNTFLDFYLLPRSRRYKAGPQVPELKLSQSCFIISPPERHPFLVTGLVESVTYSTRHPGVILDFWPCQFHIWFPWLLSLLKISSFFPVLLLRTLFIHSTISDWAPTMRSTRDTTMCMLRFQFIVAPALIIALLDSNNCLLTGSLCLYSLVLSKSSFTLLTKIESNHISLCLKLCHV